MQEELGRVQMLVQKQQERQSQGQDSRKIITCVATTWGGREGWHCNVGFVTRGLFETCREHKKKLAFTEKKLAALQKKQKVCYRIGKWYQNEME